MIKILNSEEVIPRFLLTHVRTSRFQFRWMASKLFTVVRWYMPGLSKFTVSKFAVYTFFNSVSKIQTLDTKMLLTPSASNTKENKFEHIPSEARQLRHRNLTVLWRTCKSREINKGRIMFFFFSIGSSLVKIYLPRLKVTWILSALADPIDRWQLLLFEVGHSQMTHAWPCCYISKANRKLASVLHSDHVLKGPFPTLMQRSRLFLFWATAFL